MLSDRPRRTVLELAQTISRCLFPAKAHLVMPTSLKSSISHAVARLHPESFRFISYQGNDHAIQVEEKHDEVKAKLDEGFLTRDE